MLRVIEFIYKSLYLEYNFKRHIGSNKCYLRLIANRIGHTETLSKVQCTQWLAATAAGNHHKGGLPTIQTMWSKLDVKNVFWSAKKCAILYSILSVIQYNTFCMIPILSVTKQQALKMPTKHRHTHTHIH